MSTATPTPLRIRTPYYHPSRGGHAPGDLRDAFAEAVEAGRGDPNQTVELRDQTVTLARVAGLLWNCRDVMPGDLC